MNWANFIQLLFWLSIIKQTTGQSTLILGANLAGNQGNLLLKANISAEQFYLLSLAAQSCFLSWGPDLKLTQSHNLHCVHCMFVDIHVRLRNCAFLVISGTGYLKLEIFGYLDTIL